MEGAPESTTARRQVHQPTVRGRSLGSLLERSELAFVGEVVQLEVVKSAADLPGHTALPHTFVTYRVDDLVRGTAGPVVTLRFIGGLDEASGRVLHASRVPEFELGDRDLLFVAGNGTTICPLVDQVEGRFRIVDGLVHNGTGTPLALDASDGVLPVEVANATGATSVEAVLAVLAKLNPTPPATAFVDANPRLPFYGPDFTAAPPPTTPDEPSVIDPEEAAERALLPAPVRPVRGTQERR
ncbi:MAG: hypothetical protein WD226_06500 [Planctomycetota bacterium]